MEDQISVLTLVGQHREVPSNLKKVLRQTCEKGLSMSRLKVVCVIVAPEAQYKRKIMKLQRKTYIMSSK